VSELTRGNFASSPFVRVACNALAAGTATPHVSPLASVQPLASGLDPYAPAPDAETVSLWRGWTGAALLVPIAVILVLVAGAWAVAWERGRIRAQVKEEASAVSEER